MTRRREIRADECGLCGRAFFYRALFSHWYDGQAGLGDALTTTATSSGSSTHERNASLTPVMELPSFLPISPGLQRRCRVANFWPLFYRTIVNVLINNNELVHTLAHHPGRQSPTPQRRLRTPCFVPSDQTSTVLSTHFPNGNRARLCVHIRTTLCSNLTSPVSSIIITTIDDANSSRNHVCCIFLRTSNCSNS